MAADYLTVPKVGCRLLGWSTVCPSRMTTIHATGHDMRRRRTVGGMVVRPGWWVGVARVRILIGCLDGGEWRCVVWDCTWP